jgi:lysophospholipase L1-like esterase
VLNLSRFLVFLLSFILGVTALQAENPTVNTTESSLSFKHFDEMARQGQPLSVVFFGGSLTWGANASDPQTTSYRGRMMEYLRQRYPKSSFSFHDAAIGGTGSDLGLFRLDRDVLAHKPDLVFLDFTANDGLDSDSRETAVAYETLLHEMVGRGIPVEQVIFGFRYNFGKSYNLDSVKRRAQHLQLAQAYHTAVGDIYPFIQSQLESGVAKIEVLWAIDGAHPDDPGYTLFFEAAKNGFEQAIADGRVCALPPKPVFGALYQQRERRELTNLTLPNGWEAVHTYRTSLWFDGLSSRWMSKVAAVPKKDAATVAPLRFEFDGTLLGLLGEANETAPSFQIKIDGKEILPPVHGKEKQAEAWTWDTARFGKGNLFRWLEISDKLNPGHHVAEISPVIAQSPSTGAVPNSTPGQLRIGSIGTAAFQETP